MLNVIKLISITLLKQINMETKEIKINVPEGYEIDVENSSFKKIVFKKKKETKRWRDNKDAEISGYCISAIGHIIHYNGKNIPDNYTTFATKKQAQAALAMARISQILANDSKFGGVITDKEWKDAELIKYVILRDNYLGENIIKGSATVYHFLSFHTKKEADLFLDENADLVNDYFMVEN